MEMLGETRVTKIGDTSIAWTELGSGPPIVLLHGLADSHRTWRLAAPALATRFRVVMPDLPGHGLSGRPDAPYTLEWYADTLVAWLDAAGIDRASLVGHSYGGGVAQWMALRARARIDRLVLVAAGGLGREVGLGLRIAATPHLGLLLAQPLMGPCTRVMMRAAGNVDAAEIDRAAWMNTAPGAGRAFHRTVRGCIDVFGQRLQTWDHIHEIDELPPMAILWGDRDPIIPVGHAARARDRLAFASFAEYAGVGHFPHLEVPERFSADLLSFFATDVGPARLRMPLVTARRPSRLRRWLTRLRETVVRLLSRRPALP